MAMAMTRQAVPFKNCRSVAGELHCLHSIHSFSLRLFMLAKKAPAPGNLRNPSGFRVHVVLSSITGLTMEGRNADVEGPDEDGARVRLAAKKGTSACIGPR